MDGLFFLMSVAGVGIVMWWVVQNDRVAPDRQTVGLFAMVPGSQIVKRRRLRGWISTVIPPPRRRKSRFDTPPTPPMAS
jgi:hypothetical protein